MKKSFTTAVLIGSLGLLPQSEVEAHPSSASDPQLTTNERTWSSKLDNNSSLEHLVFNNSGVNKGDTTEGNTSATPAPFIKAGSITDALKHSGGNSGRIVILVYHGQNSDKSAEYYAKVSQKLFQSPNDQGRLIQAP